MNARNTLVIALLVLAGIVSVFGDDGEYRRSLSRGSSSNNHVEFRSKRKDNGTEEELRFFVGFESDLRIRIRYEKEDANTELETQYSVTFTSLDTVTAAGVLVKSLNFASVQWKNVAITPVGNNFDVTIESQDGSIKMIGHIVSDVTTIQGVPVRPTSLKFDVELAKTTTDFLRLNARVFSSEELESDDDSDERREGFTNIKEKQVKFGQGVGFFSWAEFATIGNQNITVSSTNLANMTKGADSDDDDSNESGGGDDDDGENGGNSGKGHNGRNGNIAFTFQTNQIGQLVWDPKLSVSTEGMTGSSTAVTVSIFFLLCALLF
eukprot:TRINITY_DN538_c0_g1_i1.p1 TRINITY_DN538_c0_g1~~TRINITY_DN538_c0_g1_i1.p1  ORF type:complete len:322 (-),score=98.89 TRINITY_DN538_c0_g1_i1:37-1002(-)